MNATVSVSPKLMRILNLIQIKRENPTLRLKKTVTVTVSMTPTACSLQKMTETAHTDISASHIASDQNYMMNPDRESTPLSVDP